MPTNVSPQTVEKVFQATRDLGGENVRSRAVADKLGIAKVTVGAAYAVLQNEGRVTRRDIHVGKGFPAAEFTLVDGVTAPVSEEVVVLFEGPPTPESEGVEVKDGELHYRGNSVALRVAKYLVRQRVGSQFTARAINDSFSRLKNPPTKAAVQAGIDKLARAGYIEATGSSQTRADGSRHAYYRILKPVVIAGDAGPKPRARKASTPPVSTSPLGAAGFISQLVAQRDAAEQAVIDAQTALNEALSHLELVNNEIEQARALLG